MVSITKTRRNRQRGFTILELMVVISIILILVSIAAPIYSTSVLRAKEAVLRDDLFQLRSLISQYTQDDVLDLPEQTQTGINDVHSGATGIGTDGVPYTDW